MRRMTAIKLSLYIFARVGGSVKRRILKGSDAVTAGVCMGKPLTQVDGKTGLLLKARMIRVYER